MVRFFYYTFCFLFFNIASFQLSLNANQIETPSFHEPVAATLIAEETSIQPGRPFWVAVRLDIADQWHAYWKNPGDAGMAPVIEWQLPEGFSVGASLWPTPKRFNVENNVGFGYENGLTLLTLVTPPSSYQEKNVVLKANTRWVVCSDSSCLPGGADLSLSLAVDSRMPIESTDHAEAFSAVRNQIPSEITQKDHNITAERKEGLVELTFNHLKTESTSIQKVEFFPEEMQTIDYKTPVVFESNSDQHKLLLKERQNSAKLKGVLVFYTSTGNQSYAINTPILPLSEEISVITLNENSIKEQLPDDLRNEVKIDQASSFEFEGGIALALVFAFIGGLLLNLMPCVLPVISFKVLGFIKIAGQDKLLILKHGLFFTLGVLISFWSLAGLLLILQAYGNSVGWGFQLQEPIFVGILAAILFLCSLSLFGIFEIGNSIVSMAGQADHKSKNHGLLGSFLSGVLATAVATPCTGPFLGTAIGYAFTLPPASSMLIFTSLGLGMSLPYLVLSAFPQLLRVVPKPGPWMTTFKGAMGFLMLASTVWLIWVFSAQTDSQAVALFVASLFFFGLGSSIYGHWVTPIRTKITRIIASVVTLLLFTFGGYIVYVASFMSDESSMLTTDANKKLSDGWEVFSPERVQELRKQGIPVFIDFTAKWCLICQANHLALSTKEVEEQFNALGVVKMKADWTKRDAVISGELKKFGRNSVPLYVLYGGNKEEITNEKPVILPQVLTPEIVMNSLKTIKMDLMQD